FKNRKNGYIKPFFLFLKQLKNIEIKNSYNKITTYHYVFDSIVVNLQQTKKAAPKSSLTLEM
ncbi:hypothetical protein ACI3RH_13580, partial [Lactococcus lactis]